MTEAKQKILIVDDERLNINVLNDLLKTDYKIMAAINGKQALKAAESKSPPDLILLDIMMPEMDGYEVCSALKTNEKTKDIPVIFVTAMGQTTDETKGLEVGAVDYLTKPISPPIVQARVKTHLERKRQRDELQKAYRIIEAQKERMQEELNVGREIQMGMVPLTYPAFPDRNEFDIYATLIPAREVGGDFYDFFFIDENRLCFCVGDVSGKGVPAALFMAVTQTLIKSRAKDDDSTASIITHVNDELSRDNKKFMFVTLFIVILDLRTGQMTYTNAGHNPPYIKRKGGDIERLDRLHGPVAGAMGGTAYKEDIGTLSNGDMFLMYTDGVTEAKSPSNDFYTEERLTDLLGSRTYDSAEDLMQATVASVKKFEDTADQFDDITVLVLKYSADPTSAESSIIELSIINDLSEIDRFKLRFNEFCDQNEISVLVRRQMNMVFDEMFNNIISYAYSDEDTHEIGIKVERSMDRLAISITDDGAPFNPFSLDQPDTGLPLENRQIGGVGIHLVRNVMDKFSYQRRVEKNVVTLVKNLNQSY